MEKLLLAITDENVSVPYKIEAPYLRAHVIMIIEERRVILITCSPLIHCQIIK